MIVLGLKNHLRFLFSWLMNAKKIWLSYHMKMTYNIFKLQQTRPFRIPFQTLPHMSHVLKGSLKRKSAHLFVYNFLKTRSILLFMKKDQNQEKKIPFFSSRRKDFMFFRIQWQICCSQQWRWLLQYSVMKGIMVNYVFGGPVTNIYCWPEDLIRIINQGGIYSISYIGRHITHDVHIALLRKWLSSWFETLESWWTAAIE